MMGSEGVKAGIIGLVLGAILGAAAWLVVYTWLLDEPLLFAGDLIVLPAVICGLAGFLLGDAFIEWLKGCFDLFNKA